LCHVVSFFSVLLSFFPLLRPWNVRVLSTLPQPRLLGLPEEQCLFRRVCRFFDRHAKRLTLLIFRNFIFHRVSARQCFYAHDYFRISFFFLIRFLEHPCSAIFPFLDSCRLILRRDFCFRVRRPHERELRQMNLPPLRPALSVF